MTREQKQCVRETLSAMRAVLIAADDAVTNPLDSVTNETGADTWFLVQCDELESVLMMMIERLRRVMSQESRAADRFTWRNGDLKTTAPGGGG